MAELNSSVMLIAIPPLAVPSSFGAGRAADGGGRRGGFRWHGDSKSGKGGESRGRRGR